MSTPTSVRVASLHVYPVKGCRGTDLTRATVTRRGIRHDRELMLADEDGVFVSQRRNPRLALFRPDYDGSTLRVTGPDGDTLVHQTHADGPRLAVRVHQSRCEGVDQGDEASAWFSARLGRTCRLVRFPDDGVRAVDPDYADGEVAFADGFPLLVASQESLDDLSEHLDRPLPMNRFRPNVVLSGFDEPWAEDRVHLLRIGDVELALVRQCARCVVTTVDQDTGVTGREPLRTLAAIRRVRQRLLFAANAVPLRTGTVRVGDPVEVVERAEGSVPL